MRIEDAYGSLWRHKEEAKCVTHVPALFVTYLPDRSYGAAKLIISYLGVQRIARIYPADQLTPTAYSRDNHKRLARSLSRCAAAASVEANGPKETV